MHELSEPVTLVQFADRARADTRLYEALAGRDAPTPAEASDMEQHARLESNGVAETFVQTLCRDDLDGADVLAPSPIAGDIRGPASVSPTRGQTRKADGQWNLRPGRDSSCGRASFTARVRPNAR